MVEDLTSCYLDLMTWNNTKVGGVIPLPRSLHSCSLHGDRMFVFGGWVPLLIDDLKLASHEKVLFIHCVLHEVYYIVTLGVEMYEHSCLPQRFINEMGRTRC